MKARNPRAVASINFWFKPLPDVEQLVQFDIASWPITLEQLASIVRFVRRMYPQDNAIIGMLTIEHIATAIYGSFAAFLKLRKACSRVAELPHPLPEDIDSCERHAMAHATPFDPQRN